MRFSRFSLVVGISALLALASKRLAGSGGRGSVVSRTSLVARNLRLVRLGARGGSRYAAHRARKVFASAERADELDTEFQINTAEDVTKELGQMKGAMMKIGQMASYLDTGLPDNVRNTLASLQHDAPPMSKELAAEQIKSELGAPPEALFAEWDPTPIASASIGQVHRAITKDNRAVAVKVQYPGVADAVASDLGNADWLFGAMATMFPGIDKGPIVDEIRSRLTEELDYTLEAQNQQTIANAFIDHPTIRVPHVLPEFSTAKILTSELATGSRFSEVVDWSQEERNLTAETLFRFSFGSIYQLHVFNGDPHPGNYLFEPGGKVTFLDFGLVKRFTVNETQLFEDLIRAMVTDRDYERFRSVIVDAGLLPPDAPFSTEEVIDYFGYFYRYVMEDKPTKIDAQYAADGVDRLFNASGEQGAMMKMLNVPPSFVVLQRITLGLMGLFAQLDTTANWRRIAEELWPFVSGPPSTPMGEEIAAWTTRRAS